MPERPEFYKFDLFNQPMHLEEFLGKSLILQTYVVLDPETAGLRRSQGDDIISLAGVRIRDGEMRRDDGFDGLINPGRAIPKGSIKFHGITDDMLSGAPTVPDVLRRIRDYVGDAVLVAHNAAFDMKFLKLKETDAGVAFDHVVLDTLLLSVFPRPPYPGYHRRALRWRDRRPPYGARRFSGHGRRLLRHAWHAGVIVRLHQTIKASNNMLAVRKMQQQL
jgi:DNA polymerase-3 subunit epsilon